MRPWRWSLATRAYRVRVLNGSNARIYKLAWSDGTPMTVLGTDGGLLERPREQRFVTLAPAQRAELWLDLSTRAVGSTFELRSEAFPLADAGLDMGGGGMGMGMGMGGMRAREGAVPLGAPLKLLGITVAGRIAEIVTGRTFDVFMQERLLDPLGMKDTAFHPETKLRARIARTYKTGDDGGCG